MLPSFSYTVLFYFSILAVFTFDIDLQDYLECVTANFYKV